MEGTKGIVIGGGTMGSDIAAIFVANGHDAEIVEPDDASRGSLKQRVAKSAAEIGLGKDFGAVRALALFAAMALALGAALGGAAPFGRALMALGAPEWAGAVFQDPDWRAAARYRAGDYAGAADEALDSRWAHQVGARAERIAALYREAATLVEVAP